MTDEDSEGAERLIRLEPKGKQSVSSTKGKPSPAKALQPQPAQLSLRLHELRVAGLAGGALVPPVPVG